MRDWNIVEAYRQMAWDELLDSAYRDIWEGGGEPEKIVIAGKILSPNQPDSGN